MNTLESVAAIQRATAIVAGWDEGTHVRVLSHMPTHVRDRRISEGDWAVTVEVTRRDWETPADAAERLKRYLLLHEERWDETPTLATIRTRTIQENA